mgnify:CR=1 FL=1
MLEAVGTPPFVVLGVCCPGLCRGRFQQVLCAVGLVIFLKVQIFKDISKVLVA